jgi:hypothetical protein
MHIMQNLNHWFPSKGGHFDVAISYSLTPSNNASDWQVLTSWPDAPANEMVTRTFFNRKMTLPNKAAAHAILRARYVSNNPLEIDPSTNTDAIFYNCADIRIVAAAAADNNDNNKEQVVVVEQPQPQQQAAVELKPLDNYQCNTPASWTGQFMERNDWGFVSHTIYYDMPTERVRWIKNGTIDGTSGAQNRIDLINLYGRAGSPIEYVNFLARGQCFKYGNDRWESWRYGNDNGMTHVGRGADGIDRWISGDGIYEWTTQDLGDGLCAPVSWRRGEASISQLSFTASTRPLNPTVFVPAADCVSSTRFVCQH